MKTLVNKEDGNDASDSASIEHVVATHFGVVQ